MSQVLKRTKYCNLLVQGLSQEGEDISAVERIFVKALNREEIRFAWYKEKNGSKHFQLRPLDLTEEELLELLKDGVNKGVFTSDFRKKLKEIL
ncbi:hypothetical protein F4694_005840 [Bacillus niacini]|uniref:Uncharacterized protein n=1 Tax=Neobacillus niacini TaxID=86668 RepID=A0A852TJM4_9BACI|nr:hypothetical protein [Neobacillus niacini]NYE08983.1 hypothetical protein [Neobacillus niacini]